MDNKKFFEQTKILDSSIIRKLKDSRGLDLSEYNLCNVPIDVLIESSFDTTTKWPRKEKLPNGFNPESIIENGKNAGLGVNDLHKEGIIGSGVHVAIIDQKLDEKHQEYKDSIISIDSCSMSGKEDISLHGPAVTSILCGKNIGIAPGSNIHYFNVPSGGLEKSEDSLIESIKKIIEYNKSSQDGEKIRIINHSANRNEKLRPYIKLVEDNGIIYIDSSNSLNKFNIIIGGSMSDKENFDEYKITKTSDDSEKEIMAKYTSNIVVPSDYRTIASSWNGYSGYEYTGRGGLSWSMPYLSGVFAMALQVNPNLSENELIRFLNDSSVKNKDGVRVINPKGFIELAKHGI